jgi:hypothetical protein
MPDPDHPDHVHRPLLRLTVSHCPDDLEALVLDVDLGAPVDGVTAEDVGHVLAVLLARLIPDLDRAWSDLAASRN